MVKQDKSKREGNCDKDDSNMSKVFEHKQVANFSDDAIAVLGWKGTGVLFVILLVGFSVFKVFA